MVHRVIIYYYNNFFLFFFFLLRPLKLYVYSTPPATATLERSTYIYTHLEGFPPEADSGGDGLESRCPAIYYTVGSQL